MIKRLKNNAENNQKIAQAILNYRKAKKIKSLTDIIPLKWTKKKLRK